MTEERDGKSRRTDQPDLLASLPAERPPASRPAPGIDPAAIEELLTAVQDLRNEFAGLKEAVSAERLAPVTLEDLREQFAGPREAEPTEGPAPVTQEALEAWGDNLVSRVAEAARTADTPGDDAATERIERMEDAPGDNAAAAHIGRMEEAAAKAAAAAERIAGGQDSTADRVAAEIEGAVTRIETGLATTRNANRQESRRADPTLEVIKTRVAGPRFGWRTVLACLIFFVLGMLLESYTHILYRWL